MFKDITLSNTTMDEFKQHVSTKNVRLFNFFWIIIIIILSERLGGARGQAMWNANQIRR